MIRQFILLIFLIVLTFHVKASEGIVDLESLYLETEKAFGSNRQLYLPDESIPKYYMNLGFDLDLSRGSNIVYSNNVISSVVDQSQFRYVALDSELGVNTPYNFQLYIRHYSGHMMDAVDPSGVRFPEENTIGLRFNLFKK